MTLRRAVTKIIGGFAASGLIAVAAVVWTGVAAARPVAIDRVAVSGPDCTPTASGGNLCVLNASTSNALVVSGGASLSLARDLVVNSSSATGSNISGGG